jgi:enamine deaminase RidA (YjgF/YER057c/UK114 family)
MLKSAEKVIAYTRNPEQQLVAVIGPEVTEFHGAYTPRTGSSKEQAQKIANFVSKWGGGAGLNVKDIVAGRVFAATQEDLDALLAVQGELFDGDIPPQTLLHAEPCEPGATMAYQFEGIVSRAGTLGFSANPVYDEFEGRIGTDVKFGDVRRVYLRNITGKDTKGNISGDCRSQADHVYRRQQKLLDVLGMPYDAVPRVHIFLEDMYANYDAVNGARNAHLIPQGIGGGEAKLPPASTCIEVPSFPLESMLTTDLIVQTGVQMGLFDSPLQTDTWDYVPDETGGLENPVNFSRLANAMLAYISGQSHIVKGISVHTDDFAKALRQTFVGGESVLAPHGLNMSDVASMISYVNGARADPERYNQLKAESLEWIGSWHTRVAVHARVCREELLYEHGFEAYLSAEKESKGDPSAIKRDKGVLDSRYVPRDMLEKLMELMPGARVIPRN